ncbi:MAG TPA: ferrous iron transport protein B [Bacteroidota bacterium]|nr:ferrous iron transport protein B [Bacteroidota bacterium]
MRRWRMRRRGEAVPSRVVAFIGNPNSGKTTLFNALTGLRQKVANYPGVTVEKKEGRLLLPDGPPVLLIDLPGTYSLTANSPDEQIAVDVLLGRTDHTPPPQLVVCVVDACNLERSLYLVSQLLDRGIPLVVALNMVDAAQHAGITVNSRILARELGVPVVPTVATKRGGIQELKSAIAQTQTASGRGNQWRLPEPVERETDELMALLHQHHGIDGADAYEAAVGLLSGESVRIDEEHRYVDEIRRHVHRDHQKLDFLGFDRRSVFVESRYQWIRRICREAVQQRGSHERNLSDRIDAFVTHPFWGMVVFMGVMALLFQSIFTWAQAPMTWIHDGFDALGLGVAGLIPPGDLQDLIVKGAIGGVSAVVSFLPQILLLFFFIGILEDSGYMARAAFIMDRVMGKVGLHGKSFIPLLSSFACAIPGIMATRTIESPKDRLATMLVAPLMSCSARLPVYTLLIAAFIPPVTVLGLFSLAGITLLSMYLLGLVAALASAWLFKKTFLKSPPPVFLMELPQYKIPSLKSVVLHMIERAMAFLQRAGTIILGASIILWFLATYPKTPGTAPSENLQHSFAGMAGRVIAPVIKPLGFDWKIGIGLVSSLLQREVFVSTMGTIYGINTAQGEQERTYLGDRMRADKDPATGKPVFSVLTAICIMVYYVLAMQCLSTVAVMRRETNSWRWPLFQIGYMTALAYLVTYAVYRGGLILGLGG